MGLYSLLFITCIKCVFPECSEDSIFLTCCHTVWHWTRSAAVMLSTRGDGYNGQRGIVARKGGLPSAHGITSRLCATAGALWMSTRSNDRGSAFAMRLTQVSEAEEATRALTHG